MLAPSGVNPRTAMELMRHSDIRLTTNIYQHLELADTAGAVNQLPMPKAETEARATGTDASRASSARKERPSSPAAMERSGMAVRCSALFDDHG